MKVSRQQLRSIIKEELSTVLRESDSDGDGTEDSEDLDAIRRRLAQEEEEEGPYFDPHYEQEMEREQRASDSFERAEEKKKFLRSTLPEAELPLWIEEFIAEEPVEVEIVMKALKDEAFIEKLNAASEARSQIYDVLMDEMGYSDFY